VIEKIRFLINKSIISKAMNEQPLITPINNNTLSVLPKNGKNNSTSKNYLLTEENLKLHTGMVCYYYFPFSDVYIYCFIIIIIV
jgi:hypothetical protein